MYMIISMICLCLGIKDILSMEPHEESYIRATNAEPQTFTLPPKLFHEKKQIIPEGIRKAAHELDTQMNDPRKIVISYQDGERLKKICSFQDTEGKESESKNGEELDIFIESENEIFLLQNILYRYFRLMLAFFSGDKSINYNIHPLNKEDGELERDKKQFFKYYGNLLKKEFYKNGNPIASYMLHYNAPDDESKTKFLESSAKKFFEPALVKLSAESNPANSKKLEWLKTFRKEGIVLKRLTDDSSDEFYVAKEVKVLESIIRMQEENVDVLLREKKALQKKLYTLFTGIYGYKNPEQFFNRLNTVTFLILGGSAATAYYTLRLGGGDALYAVFAPPIIGASITNIATPLIKRILSSLPKASKLFDVACTRFSKIFNCSKKTICFSRCCKKLSCCRKSHCCRCGARSSCCSKLKLASSRVSSCFSFCREKAQKCKNRGPLVNKSTSRNILLASHRLSAFIVLKLREEIGENYYFEWEEYIDSLRNFVNDDTKPELKWLADQLDRTQLPIIRVHQPQPLENDSRRREGATAEMVVERKPHSPEGLV